MSNIKETAVLTALALAAHYFPQDADEGTTCAAPFDQAAFLLSGKYWVWDAWSSLTHEEKQRITLLGRIAPGDLTQPHKFTKEARSLLAPLDPEQPPRLNFFTPVGENPFNADAAIPQVGGDLLGFADRQLARFRRPSARPKPGEFAGPGKWSTPEIFVKDTGLVRGNVTIPTYPQFTETFGHERLPTATTVPYAPHLEVPTNELLDLAKAIDDRYQAGNRYLYERLALLFAALQTSDTVSPQEILRLNAGGTQLFNAPTGTGKSVMVRVMGSWFALQGMRVAIILPDIKACLAARWDIKQDLQHLEDIGIANRELRAAHLMSSNGMHEQAMKIASLIDEDPAAPGEWGERGIRDIDELSYGCAQKTFLRSSGEYPTGREPCFGLTSGSHRANCPWIPTCGKYTSVYQACEANVIVMNHYMFMQGNIPIGVNLDDRPVRGMTAAELALRTCHAVLLDEVDLFQSRSIEKSASEILLHSRRHWTAAPQEMDTDAKRLPIAGEHDLQPSVSHVRLMAEFLLLSITQNALTLHVTEDERAQTRVPDETGTRWHLPRGRDRKLLRLLWPDLVDEETTEIPTEVHQRLDALMPARYRRHDELRDEVDLEPPWHHVKRALQALVTPRSEHLLDSIKVELHDLLGDTIKDAHRRAQAINMLATRTTLIELDDALAELQKKAQGHRSSGLRSAHRILEKLQSTAMTAVFPLGMLGRSITGYRVTGLDDKEKNAAIAAQTIAGDPHAFTAQLGGIVSLTLAGCERPVMGLSATGYLPQAVKEHLFAPVRWWMTDAQADSIRARKHRITYSEGHRFFGDPITVSGLHPVHKQGALIELGESLYDQKIHRELEKARDADPDRAHVLVVANSYQQCAWLARGIAQASNFTSELLCLAVRPEQRHSLDPDLPKENIAKRLTPEEFEAFPKYGRILVVPLARIARGLNIVVGTRSAVRSVYLCVRPLARLDEPAEMYASMNAAGMRALPIGGSSDPAAALATAEAAARERLGLLVRTAPQFTAMHKSLQEELIAGMIVDLIQLAGRARRGGTEAILHMVDYAFQEDTWNADLETVLRRIHSQWTPDIRRQMNNLYGEALNAFLSYAGIEPEQSA